MTEPTLFDYLRDATADLIGGHVPGYRRRLEAPCPHCHGSGRVTLDDTPGDPRHHARATDPDTSHNGVADNPRFRTGTVVAMALGLLSVEPDTAAGLVIRAYGPDTPYSKAHTLTRRVSTLGAWGLIEDSGERRTNPGGREAIVWQVTPLGLQVLDNLADTGWSM